MPSAFKTFNERARKVLILAQEEAHRINHSSIGAEHLLLGIIREGHGVAARVLIDRGVNLAKARSAVEFIIGRSDAPTTEYQGLTPSAESAIKVAADEAGRLDHRVISTEHLLLGLIGDGDSVAVPVLESMGVNLARVRQDLLRMVSPPGEDSDKSLSGPFAQEDDWVRRARAGEDAAFAAIVQRYEPEIRQRIVQQLGTTADTGVEALTRECFERARST